jgi:hypothetical protein
LWAIGFKTSEAAPMTSRSCVRFGRSTMITGAAHLANRGDTRAN